MIKISGMEIYNEVVRDLLKTDSGPLRLLDDPEVFYSFSYYQSFCYMMFILLHILVSLPLQKGTIVEKLEEETVKDSQHLRHLISICDG